LLGRNTATYKFAFAQSLLVIVNNETTRINLSELTIPFCWHIIEHLKNNDKQGNSRSSTFLSYCRDFIADKISD